MRRAVVAVAALAIVLAASTAQAYVRSVTDKGTPVWWAGDCAFLIPDATPSEDMPLDTELQVLDLSIATWQTATVGAGCSYLAIHRQPPAAVEAHLDYQNVMKFRTDKWCRPAEKNNPEMCYSPQAAAITTVFYVSDKGQSDDGRIVDADIELNAINYTFANLPSNTAPRPGTQIADLQNTLTHELGHFQGLDHTCWDSASQPSYHPVDDLGNPIPACSDVLAHPAMYQSVIRDTMFNYASPGETSKRTVEPEDARGICAIYPIARDPHSCVQDQAPGTGGCDVGGGGSPIAGGLVCFAIAALLLRRRVKSA